MQTRFFLLEKAAGWRKRIGLGVSTPDPVVPARRVRTRETAKLGYPSLRIQVSNEKKPGCLGYIGVLLHSYMGVIH